MRTSSFYALVAGLLLSTPLAAEDWTGVYIGGGIGADAVLTDVSARPADGQDGRIDAHDFGGGDLGASIKAGGDWQLNNWLLIGAFANYDWSAVETKAGLSGSIEDVTLSGTVKLLDLQHSWAVGGRIGLVASPTIMAYGLLGYTQAKLSSPSITASFTEGGITETETVSIRLPTFEGITFGGGFEHRLSGNLSLWGEYRQSRFDSASVTAGDTVIDVEPTLHIGRIGISYRFGGSTHGPEETDSVQPRQWTGVYAAAGFGIDAIAGDASASVEVENAASLTAGASGIGGGDVGGTLMLGYDWQTGQYVVGGFASYDRSIHDVSISLGSDGHVDIPSLGNVWTVGGRFGYLAAPDVLAYVLAGYTRFEFSDWSVAFDDISASVGSSTYDGYTLGLGFEKLIGGNFAMRAEYRYSGLSANTITDSSDIAGVDLTTRVETDPSIHSVRLLGVYRFSGL